MECKSCGRQSWTQREHPKCTRKSRFYKPDCGVDAPKIRFFLGSCSLTIAVTEKRLIAC